jgi:branched-chain amino acid transport system ATP-binding protein
MNPFEKDGMMALIRTIRDSGVTVLLVEHDMKVVMGISDWIVCLDHGIKIDEGTPNHVQCSECVIEAYLGERIEE